MAFSSKRGRPKQTKQPHDHGTPELVAKRSAGHTREPLDRLLDKRLITPRQHWCGLHLRWLYTLRYGAPSIACRAFHIADAPRPRTDDPEWRTAREAEYKEAVCTLQSNHLYEAIMGLCVFHSSPAILNQKLQNAALKNPRIAESLHHEYQCIIHGLTLLTQLWRA